MSVTAPTDQQAFFDADPARRRSDEVELGATWRSGTSETWTLSWLCDTGELYLVRNDSLVGAASALVVLAVVPTERDLDALLEGWQDARWAEGGLAWLDHRLGLTAAA